MEGGPADEAVIDDVVLDAEGVPVVDAEGVLVAGVEAFGQVVAEAGLASGAVAAGESVEDLNFLKDLLVSKKIKAVIDREYPLEEIAEAHRYAETGRKKGNVVVTITHE